jgi:hypothetical protein
MGTLDEDQFTFLIISRSVILRTKNVPEKNCRENQNTHFIFKYCFSEKYRLWESLYKCRRAGQATDDNRAHAHCMLDT